MAFTPIDEKEIIDEPVAEGAKPRFIPIEDDEFFGIGGEEEPEPVQAPEVSEPAEAPKSRFTPISDEEFFGIEAPTDPIPVTGEEGFLRQAADVPLKIGESINTSLRALTDLFGADNSVSQNLTQNADWYRSLLSAQALEDEQEVGRILKAAEDKGIADQLAAGLEAFSVAPVDFVASGIGSLAVFVATGLVGRAAAVAGAARAGLTGARAATAVQRGVQATQLATGAGMGAGIVKGEIYQSVKDEMLAQGKTEEEARQIAMEAQSYGGKNLDQILIGAGLGTIDAFTGAEKIIGKVLTKGGLAPNASRIGSILKNGIAEGAPEFIQAAQEKFASNLALQREGVDVSLTSGVFSQGALEGLVGVGMGAGAGAIEPRTQPATKEEALAAASETQDVARQNKDVAPATASLVEGQAESVIQENAETPEQRVARLQEEATAAAGIELEEEGVGVEPTVPVTPPVAPTPEGAVAPVEPSTTGLTEGFAALGEGAVDNYYSAILQSIQEKGEVPSPERKSNVGQAWDRVKGQMEPEEFVRQLRINAEDPSKITVEPVVAEPQPAAEVVPTEPVATEVPTEPATAEAKLSQIVQPKEREDLAELPEFKSFEMDVRGVPVRFDIDTTKSDENTLYLESFRVPREERRQGIGREAMTNMLRWADENNVTLKGEALTAPSDRQYRTPQEMREQGYMTPRELFNFYKTLGWENDPEGPTKTMGIPMVYRPKPAEAVPTPETPNLEPLRRVARAEQTEDDVSGLVGQGLVELYNGQPVITQAGLEALPEAERPRLTPEARKIQIDTGSNEVVAEAIAKNLRIGVDQVGTGVRMPAGWTLVEDIYVPPQPQTVEKVAEPEAVSTFNTVQDLWKAFDTRGRGHKRFRDRLESMVEDGALTDDARDMILATLWDNNVNDEFLANAEVGAFGTRATRSYGRGGYGRQQIVAASGALEIGYKPVLKLFKNAKREYPNLDERTAQILSTFWHEYGHAGYYSLLDSKQKKIVDDAFRKTTKQQRESFFEQGVAGARNVEWFKKYYAKSQSEWFAQSFAEYVLTNKSDNKKLVPIFDQILSRIKDVFKKLFNRTESVELTDIFDYIIRGEAYGTKPNWQFVTMSRRPSYYGAGPQLIRGAKDRPAPEVRESRREQPVVLKNRFYSQLERTVAAKMPNVSSPEQLKAIIDPTRGSGVKPEEIKWSGITEAIDRIASENNGRVPKEAIIKYMQDEGRVQFEPVTLLQKVEITPEQNQQIQDRAQEIWDGWVDEVVEQMEESGMVADRVDVSNNLNKTWSEAEELAAYQLKISEDPQTQYEEYQLPDGENYREVVISMPPTPRETGGRIVYQETTNRWRLYYKDAEGFSQSFPTREQAEEALEAAKKEYVTSKKDYISPHFKNVKNYIAHYRANDRQDLEGKDGTFIEEIQSDLHQNARTVGYKDDSVVNENFVNWLKIKKKDLSKEEIENQFKTKVGEEIQQWLKDQEIVAKNARAMPDKPFKKDWPLQAFKRVLEEAVASGKDWVGWTTGETQAARYDLSKRVSRIGFEPEDAMDYSIGELYAYDLNNKLVIRETNVEPDKIADYVGKEAADKILKQIESIKYDRSQWSIEPDPDEAGKFVVYDPNGDFLFGTGGEVLSFGSQEIAKQYVDELVQKEARAELSGLDLKVGGEGMSSFYDNILPKEIAKYVKKWGATVEKSEISAAVGAQAWAFLDDDGVFRVKDRKDGKDPQAKVLGEFDNQADAMEFARMYKGTTPIWRVNITPEMRRIIEEEGQALFSLQMPSRIAGMEPEAVTTKLESLGFGRGGIVSVVNEPNASFEGRTIIRDGKVVGIELNAAALKDDAAIERVLNHEIAESANADGALNRLVAGLTPKERKEINDAITRLGYAEKARTAEEAARAVELLAEGWRGRKWFDRAVARIEAWANKLGYKLTRRAAEYIAARNVSEINAEFKQAYNKFINVQGEAREGRAFVTPAENARFLELAKNPFLAEANKEELQRLVNKAARKAKYDTKNLLFHGTTHIFNVFRRDRANSENDFGKGYYFTNTEDDALQNYAGEGPDLTNRIERLSEQIQANEEVSDEVARQRAKEILSGGDRRMISAYIKMDNPFLIGGENQTFLDFFEQYDEATDEFGEPTGKLVDFVNNFKEVAAEYENINADSVAQKLYEAALGYDGLSASEAVKILKDLTSDADDINGDLAGNEIIRRTIEASGFDGIVDNLVNQKFGSARRIGSAMAGVGPETVHTIVFNSNQIKSADLITYDDNGNIIPIDQRFQPTEADIRYSIRESRREDAIPTFSEGSPEASTLSTMAVSMAKVDAASEAKGPTTYKISEIASVWMDQGGDTRQLQDLISENTNLTPANAKKVANAIAKQYDIQQSIATAFLETQTGLSVEALPEGVTLPKEVDPDRPRPVMQRLFDVFMGVRVPPVKIEVNEKTALKQQIRLKAAANRAAKQEQQRTAEEVVEIIKAMELLGPVRPKQAQALAKRAAKVIWTSEKSVEAFSEYAAKVVENANYDADLREAKDAQKRAKQLSTQKKVAMSPQREVLEDVSKIPVNKLDDPRMFAEAVNYYLRGFKAVLSPDYVVIPDAEMESYLSGAQSETQRNQRDLDREANERLAKKYGIEPDQVNEMMESIDIIKQIEAQENREALENLLTEKAIETQQGLRGYDTDNLRADQRSIVSSMLKVDPKALDPEERQRFIRITNNIIYNNQTNGAEYFVAVAKGQQSAREAAQDSTMVAKNRAWINLLPRFVSERMQRGWALELQSVSDTFRNAFGKGAMAKMYDAMGMLDLNLGFTKANNTIDEIQEKIAEFHRNLEKKYKAAARNQDGLLAEGVVGFLIQSVPKKDELTSINQRRDLIRQDIANRRRSTTEPDRVAMADRIEAILNQIDGDSIEAILNNMKREFPANHESLIWYKDTLLPQYKDFLKSFDENFNDQANNYENPNYLTIGFTSAGPSLAITPEEQSLFYDQVSLNPKQSAYTIKRVDYSVLPKGKEIEFNLRRNVFNGLSDQINKAYTSSGWQRIASFMKTPEAEIVFGGAANKDFFIERLNRLRLSRMRRGSMGSGGAIEKAVDSLSVISRKLGTGIALGGIYQWIKQPPDQLITAWGSGGRGDLLAKNIAPKTQKLARTLLNKFSIGRRGDASAGYKYINQMEGHQNRLERYFSESKWDQAKEQAGKIADVWMIALKSSDFLAASAAWMTYYEGELNKQDIKIDDWSKESDLIESDPARRQAAAFAEQMTDIYQGSSDPTSMATFAQSGKTGWENLVKAIFVPFNSFAIQQRMRLYSDARDAISGSKSGVGGLSGTIGGLILFHATKRYVIPAISGAGVGVLYGLMGVDMDEPDEEKQKEEANKNWRQFLADITGNLLVGGTPQIVESKFIDAMNRASYMVSLQLENDSILDDEGEVMSYDQYSKERSPFYRYKSFDNAMSLGMFDIGIGQAEQVALQTKMLATPEEMEMYTPEEQRLLYFSALSEWLYMMRLNDADFARLVGKARRDMIKAAKDREKELQRIRSGR
jgi:GNAT superfamily N-acetyltransferase